MVAQQIYLINNMTGQITRNSKLGQIIYETVSSINNYSTIIDIGMWNGLGTTKCVLDAIIDKKKNNINFLSIEINHTKFLEAQKNLSKYINYVNMLYGRITELEELISLDDYDDSFFTLYSRDLQQQWFKQTIIEHNTTPYIYSKIPDKIDILILDGGEYSTYGEFKKLFNKSKIIILDDTTTIKNYKSANDLRKNQEYEIIHDITNDRKGFMVAKKL